MTVPNPGQTVHLMSWRDVLRVRWDMHRKEGRNARELELYTTDDLRRLYQKTNDDPIRLRDGIVSREIRWRIFLERFCYGLLLFVSVIGAHCLVRIAPGILTVAASELLLAFLPGASNETGQHGDAGRANQSIIEALFESETDREGPDSR